MSTTPWSPAPTGSCRRCCGRSSQSSLASLAGRRRPSTGSVARVRRPLALAVVVALALALGACGDDPSEADESTPPSVDGTTVDDVELIPGESTTTIPRTPEPAVSVPAAIPTELMVTDLRRGTGYAAAVGDTLLVDYVGVRTVDGVEFDSSYDRGIPYAFPLGQGRVIAGWEQGLVGIQVGGAAAARRPDRPRLRRQPARRIGHPARRRARRS